MFWPLVYVDDFVLVDRFKLGVNIVRRKVNVVWKIIDPQRERNVYNIKTP